MASVDDRKTYKKRKKRRVDIYFGRKSSKNVEKMPKNLWKSFFTPVSKYAVNRRINLMAQNWQKVAKLTGIDQINRNLQSRIAAVSNSLVEANGANTSMSRFANNGYLLFVFFFFLRFLIFFPPRFFDNSRKKVLKLCSKGKKDKKKPLKPVKWKKKSFYTWKKLKKKALTYWAHFTRNFKIDEDFSHER